MQKFDVMIWIQVVIAMAASIIVAVASEINEKFWSEVPVIYVRVEEIADAAL